MYANRLFAHQCMRCGNCTCCSAATIRPTRRWFLYLCAFASVTCWPYIWYRYYNSEERNRQHVIYFSLEFGLRIFVQKLCRRSQQPTTTTTTSTTQLLSGFQCAFMRAKDWNTFARIRYGYIYNLSMKNIWHKAKVHSILFDTFQNGNAKSMQIPVWKCFCILEFQ